jgi:glutamine synthetase type III
MEQRFGRGRTGLSPEEEAQLQRQEHRARAEQAQEQVIFSTQIENSVIANMAEIGVYPYAVYSVISRWREMRTVHNPQS